MDRSNGGTGITRFHVSAHLLSIDKVLRMGHTMRNLTEMGLLKNRSAFICRPTPEEALKWGDSLDKLLAHKCKLV